MFSSLLKQNNTTVSKEDHLDLIPVLQLIRSENVGPKTFFSLVMLYGSAEKALLNLPEMAARGGKAKPIKIASTREVQNEIEKCEKFGARIITYKNPAYSKLLKQIDDFPPAITICGNAELMNRTTVAIVGARNSSLNAVKFAEKISSDLGSRKIVIASGLARGIDTAAHKGSLETGTIAVVAGGIDHIYPPENTNLFNHIKEKGLIIAELPFGTVPRGQNFPQRNRIISGLSWGTLVVEASFGSGSLITARMALSQNREVFAVPGFPSDPRSKGCNHLIKDGAILTENVDDILEEIYSMKFSNEDMHLSDINATNFINASSGSIDEDVLNNARKEIIPLLSSSSVSIDELIKQTSISAQIMLTIILELELAGKITRHFGNRISYIYDEF